MLFFNDFRLSVLFVGGFRDNIFPVSQVVQFQDFLLRANRYNCLKMVGDGGAPDHKVILVEVCLLYFQYNMRVYMCLSVFMPLAVEISILHRSFQTSFTGSQAAFMIF